MVKLAVTVRVSLSIALLESENSVFRKVGVSGDESASAVVLSDRIDRGVGTIAVLVPDVRVTM